MGRASCWFRTAQQNNDPDDLARRVTVSASSASPAGAPEFLTDGITRDLRPV
jgi:hypothetical protein